MSAVGLSKKKSYEHFEQASEVIPGGLMSNFRKEEGYRPTYFCKGEGPRLFDVDGNEYIDYSLSYGPSILGHSNAHLTEALVNQVRSFNSCEVNLLEEQAARKIGTHVPSAEQTRFACSGTEAVYNAVRVARGYTGKNKIVRFRGHYHGGMDELLGGAVLGSQDIAPHIGEPEGDYFAQLTNTDGRARHAFSDSFLIEWNNLEALSSLLEKQGTDIAAVLMEPVMINVAGCVPKPGYLEGVRALCDRHKVVLIFDEVITGFRMGLGGAQAHYGVTPDITTFAKALGGGFPVSAFCGKREVMDVVTRTDVMAGGTYNGHPLAMAAVIATIEELERDNGAALKTIEQLGTALGDGLRALFAKWEIPLLLQGFPGAWTLSYHESRTIIHDYEESLGPDYYDQAGLFASLLNQRGIAVQMRFCTSAAHTEKEVSETLARADDALAEMKPLLKSA